MNSGSSYQKHCFALTPCQTVVLSAVICHLFYGFQELLSFASVYDQMTAGISRGAAVLHAELLWQYH